MVEMNTIELNEDLLNTLSGKYFYYDGGYTYFNDCNENSGTHIILIHGFSMPMLVWDGIYPELCKRAHTVRYDLYGRGFSSRVEGPYNLELFDLQLSALIKYLGLEDKKVNLVGLSMGGLIAVNYTVNRPSSVDKLVLISPAGISLPGKTGPPSILKIPLIGNIVWKTIGVKTILKNIPMSFYKKEIAEKIADKIADQFMINGTDRAFFSTLKYMNMFGRNDLYEKLGRLNKKVALIWGDHDEVINIAAADVIKKLVPGVEFYKLENAGHCSVLEYPEKITEIIGDFFGI